MPENPAKYEATDLHSPVIVRFACGIVVLVGVTFAGIWIFMRVLHHTTPEAQLASRIAIPATLSPEPRLQVDDAADLAKMRAANDLELHSYGWVNRDADIIRIPIERAIELTASRGLPFRKPSNPPAKTEAAP